MMRKEGKDGRVGRGKRVGGGGKNRIKGFPLHHKDIKRGNPTNKNIPPTFHSLAMQ